ncbi:MAG: NAD-dependent epimerase/dehydratase family protein [Acidobacteria bacterium]|nr:NAD-dependent epimerase/dehydratase family protein [Acidobacteriota bacterium]
MDVKKCLEQRKVLITGGAGYLATNLVNSIRCEDCRIIRLGRPGREFPLAKGAARIDDVTGDIRDMSLWERLLDGVDVVFHFAAQTSVRVANENPPADMTVNVLPMLYLLDSCRRKGWQPIVLFAGTATEAGMPLALPVNESHTDDPTTVYDLHKLMAENYLKFYAHQQIVRGTTLRLANVYGPGPKSSSGDRGVLNQMVRKALAGEPLTLHGHGQYLRDYIYVDDVIQAFLAAVANIDRINGRHFVIGNGQGHTIAQAVELVAERVARRTGRVVPVKQLDPPEPLLPIDTRDFIADTSHFSQATGWKACTSLAEGIDRTIDALQANNSGKTEDIH